MHDTLTVGLPILVILFGTFWNQNKFEDAIDKLKKRMEDRFTSSRAKWTGCRRTSPCSTANSAATIPRSASSKTASSKPTSWRSPNPRICCYAAL